MSVQQNSFEAQDQIVREWNMAREEIIKMLIMNFLTPDFILDAKAELLEKAEAFVIAECAKKFYSHIIQGPYKKGRFNEEGGDNVEETNFLKRDENYVKVASIVFNADTRNVNSFILFKI